MVGSNGTPKRLESTVSPHVPEEEGWAGAHVVPPLGQLGVTRGPGRPPSPARPPTGWPGVWVVPSRATGGDPGTAGESSAYDSTGPTLQQTLGPLHHLGPALKPAP
jgi:hypothetical protein